MKKRKAGMSALQFHEGAALSAIADTYQTLQKVTLEEIQNAIDAGPSHIWISINFVLRKILVRDNGVGVSKSKFEQALRQICVSQKDRKKLGRFGRGLVSPFNKCKLFRFTSCPSPKRAEYRTWTFTSEILEQSSITGIPLQDRMDLKFGKKDDQESVPWRTEVEIVDFTDDRFLSKITLESLIAEILDNFGIAMRQNKTTISLEIIDEAGKRSQRDFTAEEFQGTKLNEMSIEHQDCGKTKFRMFVARRIGNKRNGKVLCGEEGDSFRINFQRMINNFNTRGYLSEEVAKALSSGVFEGEITSGIHLHPGRKSFVMDDAFVGFLITIEKWFERVGQKHLAEVQESNKEERYQSLGLRSMGVIEELCLRSEYSFIHEAIQSFKRGTIGTGHSDVDKELGMQDVSTLSTRGEPGEAHVQIKGSKKRQTPSAKEALGENAGHIPFTVAGTQGRRRKVVKSNSLGLQFRYDEMPGSRKLWELDTTDGTLVFNIRHPYWELCEPHDHALMKLQEFVAIEALTHFGLPAEMRDAAELALEALIGPYIFMLLHGDSLSGRKPGRRPTQKMKQTLALAKEIG